MITSRPLKSSCMNLRARLVSAQSSTNSKRNQAFFLRRTTPVDGDRNEVDIEFRVGAQGLDHLAQLRRRPAIETFVPEAARPAR